MINIQAKEVEQLIADHPTWRLVDVREPNEYRTGHAPSAISLPLSQFPERGHELSAYEGVVLMCRSGGRSAMACSYAEDMGIAHVANVSGGIIAWQQAGLPVTSDDERGMIKKDIAIAIAVILIGVAAAYLGVAYRKHADHFATVPASSFGAIIDTNAATLIDVRTPEEFAEGHIKGATLINYESPDFSEKIAKLNKNQHYLVYCRSGNRSSKAIAIMKQQGFTHITELKGGISAWTSANLPVTK